MASRHLPRCCFVRCDGAGGYEVGHDVKDPNCRHDTDGVRRIIGHGRMRGDAIADARMTLGFDDD